MYPTPRRLIVTMAGALLALAVPAAAAAPSNDDWANAASVTALPYVDQRNADEATIEPDEPAPDDPTCQETTGPTIWYSVKLAKGGWVFAGTMGTGGSSLFVWRGATPAGAVIVRCGGATDSSSDQRLAWLAKAGVTYHVQVRSSNPDTVLHLSRTDGPLNDDWARATSVTRLPRIDTTSPFGASCQAAGPDPVCGERGPDLWYRVRLRTTATVQVDTLMSGIDTVLEMSTGATLAAQKAQLCNDDVASSGSHHQSRITFRAIAGKSYLVRAIGDNGQKDDLVVRFRKVSSPANDALAKAAPIAANGSIPEQSTVGATLQAGEPVDADSACKGILIGATVWFKLTATTTASYVIDTEGSDFDTVGHVYTGPAHPTPGQLTEVGCSDGMPMTFGATAGTTYWIRIGGFPTWSASSTSR